MALGLDPAVNIIENGKCMIKERYLSGSGCGSVGRAVVILNIYSQLYWKDENKEKEAGNGPFF